MLCAYKPVVQNLSTLIRSSETKMWTANALREVECEKQECASHWFFKSKEVHLSQDFFRSTEKKFENTQVKKHTHLQTGVPTLLDLARLCLLTHIPVPPSAQDLGSANISALQKIGTECQRESITIRNMPTITPAGLKLRLWEMFNDQNRHITDSGYLWTLSELVSASVSLVRILEPRFLFVQLAILSGDTGFQDRVSFIQLCRWTKARDGETNYVETVKNIDRLLRQLGQCTYTKFKEVNYLLQSSRTVFEYTVISNRQLMARVNDILTGRDGHTLTALEARDLLTQSFEFHRGPAYLPAVKLHCDEIGWYLDTYIHGIGLLARSLKANLTNGWASLVILVQRDTDSEDERITDGEMASDDSDDDGDQSDGLVSGAHSTETDDERMRVEFVSGPQ